MQVAEIAVRFGDTTLDVRSLGTGSYRVGTGRDVDLAVPGLTSFPLVDWTDRGACMVRIPAGFTAHKLVAGVATPLDGGVRLARGEVIELMLGRAAISIELGQRAMPLAKPPLDTRFARWITGALVGHLIALLVIDTVADPEPDSIPMASIAAYLPQLPEPPPPPITVPQARLMTPRRREQKTTTPQLEPASTPEPIEMDPTPAKKRERAIEGARRAGILGSGGFTAEDIRKITGTADLEKALDEVGPLYREHEAEAKAFGGGRRFDPTKREGWGSVETGRYATVSGGRGAGEHYSLPGEVEARPLPKVAHCVGACTASGGLAREAVRTAIARYDEAILGCYERGGQVTRGDVVVEIRIGEDGIVIDADGAGLGTTGSCVAGVIRRVPFPKAAATTVRYPLSFSPG